MVALSATEIAALANWHITIAKGIPKRLGRAQLELSAKSIFGMPSKMKELLAAARGQMDGHFNRAKVLNAILQVMGDGGGK